MGTGKRFSWYAVSCVVCAVAILAKGALAEEENLRDVVRTLRGQVTALLERRQEDFNVLEESIRNSLDKNSELAAVKSQMEELRRDVERLQGGKKPTLNEQKNDHLTVQWLSAAVGELRGELAELSVGCNSSAEIQQRQELASGLDLLRGDVASFRRDLEELRAEQQQTVVTLGQLKQDVESSIKSGQAAAATSAATRAQVDEVRAEMSSFSKALARLSRDVKILKVFVPNAREAEEDGGAGEKKYRHNRVLRQQVEELQRSERELEERQGRLERSVRRLEKRAKTPPGPEDPRQNEAVDERLPERVARLEEADRAALKQTFNLSRQVAELSRLHVSVLRLLESVESLESRVDKSLPDFQREISKMEFNVAQTASSVTLVKEDQANQRSSMKALEESLAKLELRLETDRGHLNALQAQVAEAARRKNGTREERREDVQESRLAALEEKLEDHLEEEATFLPTAPLADALRGGRPVNQSSLPELIEALKTVQKEYDNIVHQLPHDCGAVEGRNGIYAIAPGEGPPLLVPCDMSLRPGGWTVVQRRIDGSQEFNRKWDEYASGFGTPSGEFWLGNEALHRLTAENCSSLRVDFTDIYGKKWVAEYEGFYISDAEDGYRIHVRGYSGNASDALEYQNKMQFSAVDSDRDISNTHCAQNYEGGWWFSHCQHANLNGRYNLGLTWFDGTRNEWIAVAFSEMKVRRRRDCGS